MVASSASHAYASSRDPVLFQNRIAPVHLIHKFVEPLYGLSLIVDYGALKVRKAIEGKIVNAELRSIRVILACLGVFVHAITRMMFCMSTDLPLPVDPAIRVCGAFGTTPAPHGRAAETDAACRHLDHGQVRQCADGIQAQAQYDRGPEGLGECVI